LCTSNTNNIYLKSTFQFQTPMQKLVRRMTRFFVKTNREETYMELDKVLIFAKMLVSRKLYFQIYQLKTSKCKIKIDMLPFLGSSSSSYTLAVLELYLIPYRSPLCWFLQRIVSLPILRFCVSNSLHFMECRIYRNSNNYTSLQINAPLFNLF
jgi:hypothetical protein